jgi:DNA-binding transcriptional ArsR family regulator
MKQKNATLTSMDLIDPPDQENDTHPRYSDVGKNPKLARAVEIQKKVNLFRALSSRKRLEILLLLNEKGVAVPFGRIVEIFQLNNSTISKHLKLLESVGLIVNVYSKNPNYAGHYSFYMITKTGKNLLKKLETKT